ncbi:MAG: HlyD family efflux transporter periplasmic adaptor subunit [Mariniphaga sp.]|nr:HlyD family efflux transporter periplasmic adaptor subunit [Mariniphaga sp.]
MKNKLLIYLVLIPLGLLVIFIVVKLIGTDTLFQTKSTKQTFVTVDRGQVIVSVEATGVVEAENEVIILSPSSCIVKKINKEPGSQVEKGTVIIELDQVPIQNEIERIKDQLELKRNSLEKSRLSNRSTLIDLEYNVEVKQLKITSLKSKQTDEEQLLSVGGISPSRLEETKQNIILAEKDLAMVIEKNEIRLKQLKTDEEGLLLQIKIQEKQLAEKIGLLEKMEVKAPSAGILLTVAGKVGEMVQSGKMLVCMSDLTTFKIIGSIDEKYSEYIKTGNQVFAILDNEKLQGRIGNITPAIENSKIQFNVHIENSNHPEIMPNQAVSLKVVQSLKNNILRIPCYDEIYPNMEQLVLVKDSERVVKKNVRFGIKGVDFQEIVSGLNVGEQIIISDKVSSRKIDEIESQE